MSTSNSPADTPEFAAPAETNTASDQTVASVSSDSVLTERRSGRSNLSWNVIRQSQQLQQEAEAPMNVGAIETSDRSRAVKRSDDRASRSPYPSKSPKRNEGASSSEQHLTADQRLERMIAQHGMEITSRERGRIAGTGLVGSPSRRNVSPSMAIQMNSPPRELTRALFSEPQDIPITDATSDENMRSATGSGRDPNGRKSAMGHEISELTQKQLTAELTMAEMNNQKVEAEVRQRSLEHELSQEIHHMFHQAQSLISEMRTAFNIEDQGCIRRIEMLETQRNEYATGLVELGNQAEVALQERHMQYSEEIARVNQRSEAYMGQQHENISMLRHELMVANEEIQKSNQNRAYLMQSEREMAHMNELINNELVVQRSNVKHHEAEISLMQNSMRDRHAIFNSELANLQSTIQSQRELQIQRSGFTEDEVASFIRRKINEIKSQSEQEMTSMRNTLQSEHDLAMLYKGRYEDITRNTKSTDPDSNSLVVALKARLDQEASYTDSQENKIDELREQLNEMRSQYFSEKWEVQSKEAKNDRIQRELEEQEKKVEFLESETDRLRDDRNEHKGYCQQLYEELWGNEEHEGHEEAEAGRSERAEARRSESSDSRPKISIEGKQTRLSFRIGPNRMIWTVGRANSFRMS